MKKKLLLIAASVLMITLTLAGVVGAQALPGLFLEGEDLEATGTIEEFEMDYLVVDGMRYELTEETELGEDLEIGDFVKVKYYEEGELLIALEVEPETEEFEIEGYVEEYVMDEYIIVDGIRYELTTETEILEEIAVDDFVKVKYFLEADLNIALEVELLEEEYEEFEITGVVDEVGMDFLVVDGITYLIMPDSEVEEGIEMGDTVKIKYYEDDEEQFIILEAELEDEDDDMDDDMDGKEDSAVCSGEVIHPTLDGYATAFGVEYDDLLGYFCEQKLGVGEIKHALETAELEEVEMTWQELLDWRLSDSWGTIWQELGLIGKDKNDNGETLEIQEQEKVKTNQGKSDDNPGKAKGKDKGN